LRFISQKIEVKFEQRPGWKEPRSFIWKGKEYEIEKILSRWEDHSFGLVPPSDRKWWLRRHRVYYRVRTKGGGVYELYWDRGSKKKDWVLAKEIREECKGSSTPSAPATEKPRSS